MIKLARGHRRMHGTDLIWAGATTFLPESLSFVRMFKKYFFLLLCK